jgi:hypothetical protein
MEGLLGSEFIALDGVTGMQNGRIVGAQLPQLSRFQLVFDDELGRSPERGMLVGGVIPVGALGLLIGQPASMKTFIAVDFALSVATGSEWCHRKVQQADVVYVLGEGRGGIARRVLAWKHKHGFAGRAGVPFLLEAIQLMGTKDVDVFLTHLGKYSSQIGLIIFDTLARCMVGGEENSAKDTGLVISAVDRIRQETGAAVLLIHHTGKSGKALRGSTALPGAADVLMFVKTNGDRATLTCEKMKDGEPFSRMTLRKEVVDLGSEGTSCVLVPTDAIPAAKSDRGGLSGAESQAIKCLRDFGPAGASQTKWREALRSTGSGVTESGFRKMADRLEDLGEVERDPGVRGLYRIRVSVRPEQTSEIS